MQSSTIRWLLNASPPKDKPLSVQMEALQHSYPKAGWGHFLDMGLGKTCVALNEFCMFVEDYNFKRMVVIAPNNFKDDWILMASEFQFPYRMKALDSKDRWAAERWMKQYKDEVLAIVVNYESARTEATQELITVFIGGNLTYGVFDESIMTKGHDGENFKGAKRIASQCAANRDLSGKPITQGPHDLWAQLKLIGALQGWNYHAFRNRYCVMGGFKNKQVVGWKNEKELKDYLKEWSFFALSKDYRTWAEPTWTTREVRMLPKQFEMYKGMEHDFLVDLGEGRIASAEMIITRLNKLQQITSGFLYDDEGNTNILFAPDANPRVKATRDLLNNEINGKLIVGALHTAAIEMLMGALQEFNPVRIVGKNRMEEGELQYAKDKFNNDDRCRVVVGQLVATKYGHTLLGSAAMPCYHTAFFENSFSLDTRSQFEKRNDRTGQTMGVQYIDFIQSPMDRRVVGALQRKEDIASAVLGYARELGILKGVKV